jgi:ferredoxin hydrogenase large subunit
MAMGLFDHEARQFKFDVLREVALARFAGPVVDTFPDDLAYKLIPTNEAQFRCCVYKEREIIRQRTRLALGQEPNPRKPKPKRPRQIVKVLEAACDGCTIQRIQITDNCRKCMAKSCKTACKVDAISMGPNRAVIDHSKCVECGACVKACPFHAIIDTPRPCKASCTVDAIDLDEYNIARIDEEKCINCAACQSACPFGAIEDQSWVVNVIDLIESERPTIAMVAPSIQGQFDSASLEQIKTGIRMLGFSDVLEVAIGADVIAWYEKDELKERMADNIPMTSSCCPAFVNLARQHYPDVYEKNMSSLVSPMVAVARYVKKIYPDYGVVFIGPCVAKKQEGMDGQEVDYVLTYEEIAAMLVAKHIYLEDIEPETTAQASIFGRNFAFGGGVSQALAEAMKQDGNIPFTYHYADGIHECKKALMMIRANRAPANICEGMSCAGGCSKGPAVIDNSPRIKPKFDRENAIMEKSSIQQTLETFGFDDINLHRHMHK